MKTPAPHNKVDLTTQLCHNFALTINIVSGGRGWRHVFLNSFLQPNYFPFCDGRPRV